jgi:hypothetical protein
MLRASLHGLALLTLGPVSAFVVLALGCDGGPAAVGGVCGMGLMASFATLSAVTWVVLGVGMLAARLVAKAAAAGPAHTALRLWSLLALLVFGVLVGASGRWLTGSESWFLAIPASLAAGWLRLANPRTCLAERRDDASRSSGRGPT